MDGLLTTIVTMLAIVGLIPARQRLVSKYRESLRRILRANDPGAIVLRVCSAGMVSILRCERLMAEAEGEKILTGRRSRPLLPRHREPTTERDDDES
jgi:hypothetical protein